MPQSALTVEDAILIKRYFAVHNVQAFLDELSHCYEATASSEEFESLNSSKSKERATKGQRRSTTTSAATPH